MTGQAESDIGRTEDKGRNGPVAEHKVGSMDITTQEKTFAGFLWFVKWGCILIAAILIFLALVNI